MPASAEPVYIDLPGWKASTIGTIIHKHPVD